VARPPFQSLETDVVEGKADMVGGGQVVRKRNLDLLEELRAAKVVRHRSKVRAIQRLAWVCEYCWEALRAGLVTVAELGHHRQVSVRAYAESLRVDVEAIRVAAGRLGWTCCHPLHRQLTHFCN